MTSNDARRDDLIVRDYQTVTCTKSRQLNEKFCRVRVYQTRERLVLRKANLQRCQYRRQAGARLPAASDDRFGFERAATVQYLTVVYRNLVHTCKNMYCTKLLAHTASAFRETTCNDCNTLASCGIELDLPTYTCVYTETHD